MAVVVFGLNLSDCLQGSLTCSLGIIVLGLVTHKVITAWLYPIVHGVSDSVEAEDGLFSDMVLPSRCLRQSHPRYFLSRVTTASGADLPTFAGWRPVLVFANKKSGSNQGAAILEQCKRVLNPIQVHDLNKKGPASSLNLCRLFPQTQFIVLVCGGDGTVNWILLEIDRMQLKLQPMLAILPLGTGNDLANTLGWGVTYDDEIDSVENFFNEIRFATPVICDRWTITVRPSRRRFLPLPLKSKEIAMSNYFSIGCDALIALNFHRQRQKKPHFFTTRSLNRLFYIGYGAVDVLEQHCKNLNENIELWLDGIKIELPSLEGLVFLNISSWGGGCKIWDNMLPNESQWDHSNPSDGRIEVIGLMSSFHMAQIQVNLAEPLRLGQALNAILVVKRKVPMQSDGEPWEENPCRIDISVGNRVTFLKKASSIRDDSNDILQLETA